MTTLAVLEMPRISSYIVNDSTLSFTKSQENLSCVCDLERLRMFAEQDRLRMS